MSKKIKFGFEEDGIVEIYDFCPDPDGSGLQWYTSTKEFEPLLGRKKIGQRTVNCDGVCTDVGEYNTHLGELAQRLVAEAPDGTSLVALVNSNSSCGTRTFSESLTADFYK